MCEIGTRFYRWEVWRIREYAVELIRAEISVSSASPTLGLLCIPHATLIFSIKKMSYAVSKDGNGVRSMPGNLTK